MTAACKQRKKRRFQRLILKIGRSKVSADMIDPDQRNPEAVGKSLGKRQSDEKRPQKPRAIGNGHGVELFFMHPGIFQSARNDFVHRFGVRAGSDLRHNAAELCLRCGRRSDFVR